MVVTQRYKARAYGLCALKVNDSFRGRQMAEHTIAAGDDIGADSAVCSGLVQLDATKPSAETTVTED